KNVLCKLLFTVFLVSCNGQFATREVFPLDPAKYSFGKNTLSLNANGTLIICNQDSLLMKTGLWEQEKQILTLRIRKTIHYSDVIRSDSSLDNVNINENWEITNSEFGFHHLRPTEGGSYIDEAYHNDGPPESTCLFN